MIVKANPSSDRLTLATAAWFVVTFLVGVTTPRVGIALVGLTIFVLCLVAAVVVFMHMDDDRVLSTQRPQTDE